MEDEYISTQIRYFKELHNSTSLEQIILRMQPLIKKYIKKLYFMEKEDAYQELALSIIEAIDHLKIYNNEAMCITYLQKSIINKYNYLCKKSIKESELKDEFTEIPDTIPYIEDCFNNIEFSIDISRLLKNKKKTEKYIIKYALFNGSSDKEIALKLGISRQYVNRVKKRVLKNYLNVI